MNEDSKRRYLSGSASCDRPELAQPGSPHRQVLDDLNMRSTKAALPYASQLNSFSEGDQTRRLLAALTAKRNAEEEVFQASSKRQHLDLSAGAGQNIAAQLLARDLGRETRAIQEEQTLRMLSAVDGGLSPQRALGGGLFLGPGLNLPQVRQGNLSAYSGTMLGQQGIVSGRSFLPSGLQLSAQQQLPDPYGLTSIPGISPMQQQLLRQQYLRDAAMAQAQLAQIPGVNSTGISADFGPQTIEELLMARGTNSALRPQQPLAGAGPASSKSATGLLGAAPAPLREADAPLPPLNQHLLSLPPCDDTSPIPLYTGRGKYPLGIDEDPNWLSKFHCFVRLDMTEVFRAGRDDCKSRNNSISYKQVGLRCRFCAHLPPGNRTGRSSAFPSSLRQIYQSFTMMLRDHFGNCEAIPMPVRAKFAVLKEMPSQGATDSKRYWIYSAMKIGMIDSVDGIVINERTVAAGRQTSSYGTDPDQPWTDDALRNVPLVFPSDRNLVSEFLFALMSQVQLIRLTDGEKIGNRRSLDSGLPGLGCRYCCEHRRLGMGRMFPARRRTLTSKVNDLYDHVRRCALVPQNIKGKLDTLKLQMVGDPTDREEEKEFFDLIWSRLGQQA